MTSPHARRPEWRGRCVGRGIVCSCVIGLLLSAAEIVRAQDFRPARYAEEEPVSQQPVRPAKAEAPATSWRAAKYAPVPVSERGRYRRGQAQRQPVVEQKAARPTARPEASSPPAAPFVGRFQRAKFTRIRPTPQPQRAVYETVESRRPNRHIFPAQHVIGRRGGGNRPLHPAIAAMPSVQEKMEVIHHRSQLLIARSNIVRTAIADDAVIDIVQFSPREISIIGVGIGTTTLTIWFDNDPRPLIYLVSTVTDPSLEDQRRVDYGRLERKIADLFPNSKVALIPLSSKIVVKGQARDAAEAARILQIVRNEVIDQLGSLYGPQPGGRANVNGLRGPAIAARGTAAAAGGVARGLLSTDLASYYVINMLEVPGEFQVMLRVRIAELNRSQLRRMGIDFNYLINQGRHAVGYSLGGLPSTITGIFENGEIQVLVDWLSSNGTAKILSEPVLTVMSGHTAIMHSGGEFAVPTIVGVGGAQGQQTSFRGFGTSLLVTPTVTDKDIIRMNITPEFSTLNQSNSVGGIPGVDSRRVSTTVQLREGQTIAIAGLISHQMNTETTRIPFLSDLPYIGPRLFSAKRHTQDETELLVLVTPELVRPMDSDEVPPVPGFYVTPPSEFELYHYGLTEGAPDLEVYQLAPYGRGAGMGEPVGYRLHNPSPATPGYAPAVTDPYGGARPPVRQGTPGPGKRPKFETAPRPPLPYQRRPAVRPPRGNPLPPRPSSPSGNTPPTGNGSPFQQTTQFGSQMMRSSSDFRYGNSASPR